MASKRQIAANQSNARRSTGPRTRAGKARSAANARRHGLNTPVEVDLTLLQRARLVHEALCEGDAPSPAAWPYAVAIVDLDRLLEAKASARAEALAKANAELDPAAGGAQLEGLAVRAALPILCTLTGYERKARSRLKAARKAFHADQLAIARHRDEDPRQRGPEVPGCNLDGAGSRTELDS